MEEEELSRFEHFRYEVVVFVLISKLTEIFFARSWHDEAYLYINQAITQVRTRISWTID